jgi:hypothetical protein
MSAERAPRILFAHARQEETDAIEEGIAAINTFFPDAEVIAARDDWKKNQSSMESIQTWARHVGGGWSLMEGRPTYDLIVCPRQFVGNWTALIVNAALASRRPVAYFGLGDSLETVNRIRHVDPEDWQNGWCLD